MPQASPISHAEMLAMIAAVLLWVACYAGVPYFLARLSEREG